MRIRNVKGAQNTLNQHEKSIQNPGEFKGRWHEFFGNNAPIYIEIGMGKGTFIIENAKRNPQINYIGFEKFTAVLVRAIEKMDQEEYLPNLCVVRMDAKGILDVFDSGEIDRIYLNFSDPWPKEKHARRRLTSPIFLANYTKILKKNSLIIQKTDNENLFRYSKLQFEESGLKLEICTEDLHHSPYLEGNIMTEYESKFVEQGKNIYMLTAVSND